MSGNKNNSSKKIIKIAAVVIAIVVAFGMGILAYHEFQRNVMRPAKMIAQKEDAPVSEPDRTIEREREALPEQRQGGKAEETQQTEEAQQAEETSFIGEDAAKEAALAHAGVQESDTSYLNCHVDYDDGRVRCYDVDFVAGDTEYEYEIDLYTGNILKSSAESRTRENGKEQYDGAGTGSAHNTSSSDYIGEAAAWKAALAHAGVTEDDIVGKKAELDKENGKMVYEIEFKVGRKEYDYEIDAVTGEVLKAEEDWD